MNRLLAVANAIYRYLERIADCVRVAAHRPDDGHLRRRRVPQVRRRGLPVHEGRRSSNGTCIRRSSRCGSASTTLSTPIRASIPTPRRCRIAPGHGSSSRLSWSSPCPTRWCVVWYGWDFVRPRTSSTSARTRRSGSPTAGSSRASSALGLWLLLLAIVSVLLRLVVYLFGNRSAEEVDLQIGHVGLAGLGREHDVAGSIDNLALIMFVVMFVVIFCGYPVAFVLGGTALVFALIGWSLRRVPIDRAVEHPAAHVGRRRGRPGAGVDPDVHLHGRDPRAQRLGEGHAAARPRSCSSACPAGSRSR